MPKPQHWQFIQVKSSQPKYENWFSMVMLLMNSTFKAKLGYEIKVDIDAATGEFEEANIEIYEIGPEDE